MTTVIVDPVILDFVNSEGKSILRGDVADLMNAAVDACSKAPVHGDTREQFHHEIILAFRKIIEERCAVQLSTSQAETIYARTLKAYADFKRQLEGS